MQWGRKWGVEISFLILLYWLALHGIMDKQGWKVVYVASRREKKAYERMTELGIEAYLPMVKKLQQWSDRKKWVTFPMFSGYLFVRPDAIQRDEVLQVPGVLQYLRYDGGDAKVSDAEMQSIRNVEDSGYSVVPEGVTSDIKEGDVLVVSEGPLRGEKVRLVRSKKYTGVFVMLNSIHQALKVELPIQILEPAIP